VWLGHCCTISLQSARALAHPHVTVRFEAIFSVRECLSQNGAIVFVFFYKEKRVNDECPISFWDCSGVDIGGTGVKVAVVTSSGKVLSHAYGLVTEPRTPESVRELVRWRIVWMNLSISPFPIHSHCYYCRSLAQEAMVKANMSLSNIDAIGVGCPGGVNQEQGIVTKVANFPWSNVPLAKWDS
jgi:hypothetical protein